MITFKYMEWAHAFSYGPKNSISFTDYVLTQLLGKNGHGKSSIALILEEALYNTNSKKVKKGDILNRYSKSKTYNIMVEFDKDSDNYRVTTVRGTTQTVKLEKNGIDISSHTSTGTYKLIEEILGLDFKTFTQVVHQNNSSNLEFLTATDTNRKKFLIDLLNLNIYSKYGEIFKSVAKEVSEELASAETRLKTCENMLSKLLKEDLSVRDLIEVPIPLIKEVERVKELTNQLTVLDSLNKQIAQNNKYKEILSKITLDIEAPSPVDTLELQIEQRNYKTSIDYHTKVIKDYGSLLDKCPSCGQPIDVSHKKILLEESKNKLPICKNYLDNINEKIKLANEANIRYAKAKAAQDDFEKYANLINHELQDNLFDEKLINLELKEL
ncbi:MAG TPA: hypothetical protein V6C58_08155, partial [Allocoleopsis sp.]